MRVWYSFCAASSRVEVTTQWPGRNVNSQLVEACRVGGCTRSPPRSRRTKPRGVSEERERRKSVFCGCASKATPLCSRAGTTAEIRRRAYLPRD